MFYVLILIALGLGWRLKSILTALFLLAILLFAFVGIIGDFHNASSTDIFYTLLYTFLVMAAFIIPVYYFQNKNQVARKKANDEYGRQVWLKAQAEGEKQNEQDHPQSQP